MCLGKIGDDYLLSSESCAFDCVGGEFIRDIEPGEIVIIDESGINSIKFAEKNKMSYLCF